MAYVRFKRGRWHVYYRPAGVTKWTSTVTTAKSKTEAKRLQLEIERREERRRLGLDPLPSDATTTLWELCRWWLAGRCQPRSRKDETYRLGKHVQGTRLGSLPLGQVTKTAIEDRLREMENAGSAAASVNKVRAILHTIIHRASQEDPPLWSGPNPIEKVESRRVPRRVYHVLAPDEVEHVLAHTTKEWRGEVAAAVYLALRKGEVFGLRREDVDLRRRLLHVRRSFDHPTTKTDEEATIPIPPPVVPYLQAALDKGHALVFPGRKGKMRTKEADPEKALRRALGRAGLVLGYRHVCRRCKGKGEALAVWEHTDREPRKCARCGFALWPVPIPRPMRFHDLRHSTATILLAAGVPMQHAQRILRHAQVQTTVNLYGHMVAEHVRAAVDAAWDRPSLGPPPASAPGTAKAGNPDSAGVTGPSDSWALQVSNLRPQPCEGWTEGGAGAGGIAKDAEPLRVARPGRR
jgi:integrase